MASRVLRIFWISPNAIPRVKHKCLICIKYYLVFQPQCMDWNRHIIHCRHRHGRIFMYSKWPQATSLPARFQLIEYDRWAASSTKRLRIYICLNSITCRCAIRKNYYPIEMLFPFRFHRMRMTQLICSWSSLHPKSIHFVVRSMFHAVVSQNNYQFHIRSSGRRQNALKVSH